MEITLVKLRNTYQTYFVDKDRLFIKHNTDCIIETEHGIDFGKVVKTKKCKTATADDVTGKLIRKANEDDIKKLDELEAIEQKAYKICKEKAKAKKLDMKLISVKCLFDMTKIIFYFVADNRVDFRELVRELASVFRTRIEMRQVGVRDESRIVGGYGPCGKSLCCTDYCQEFDPVSIKMAKEQNLNLNSLKISGMCGRLLCCLAYEYDVYKEINENLPAVGEKVVAGKKSYNVIHVDTLNECIRIQDEGRMLLISMADIELKNKQFLIKEKVLENIIRQYDEHDEFDTHTL